MEILANGEKELVKIKWLVMITLILVLPCNTAWCVSAKPENSPLKTVTFWDLGYNQTTTFLYDDTLILTLDCSGAEFDLYQARIYFHFTQNEASFDLRINGGTVFYCPVSSGHQTIWATRDYPIGHFINGSNTILFRFYNSPRSITYSDVNRYTIILPDSYIEVYDSNALPLDIIWQGYEINEDAITLYFQVIVLPSRQPIDNANATIEFIIESDLGDNHSTQAGNTTALGLTDGQYFVEISLTTQAFDQLNLSLNLSIEGDGYKQTTFPFSVITNADVLVEYITVEETVIRTKTIPTTIYSNPPLNIPILFVGILIGMASTGLVVLRKSPKATLLRPFYCEMCVQWHRIGTHRWRCRSCGCSVCRTAYTEMKTVGRIKCHLCEGELQQI